MKLKLSILVLILVSLNLVFLSSCKKDKDADDDLNLVKSWVYSENGNKAIPNAIIFVDQDHDFYYTYTNSQGYFELALPEGEHLLNIQTGDGKIFRSQIQITVEQGETLELPKGFLKLQQAANLAFVDGMYDEIETIIVDSLGYTCTELFENDFDNFSTLEQYQAIFLNCGKLFNMDSLKYENLRMFVERGGSIYASDYAVEYLTGDGHTSPMAKHQLNPSALNKLPCSTNKPGGFIEDSILCTSRTGPIATLYSTTIVSQDLINLLGKNTLDVEYDLGGWEVVDHYEAPWEVLVEDANYGPLALRMRMPSNYVPPQTGNWITICHIPPGNPNNPITITININALSTHLAHGDYIGPCDGTGGTIYFTTFHNHAQGGLSDDVMRILEYYILHL
jgi:hypothetical protein